MNDISRSEDAEKESFTDSSQSESSERIWLDTERHEREKYWWRPISRIRLLESFYPYNAEQEEPEWFRQREKLPGIDFAYWSYESGSRKLIHVSRPAAEAVSRYEPQEKMARPELSEWHPDDLKFESGPQPLTPRHLTVVVGPFIEALAEIQHIIDEVKGRDRREVRILSIAQKSPVTLSIEGIAEAATAIQEIVTPWKREHGRKMAGLLEREQEALIEQLRADVLEKRARAATQRAEKEKLRAESAVLFERAEALRLENRRARQELDRDRLQLASDFVDWIKPDLEGAEKLQYVIKLLPHLDTIITSPLQLSLVDTQDEAEERASDTAREDITDSEQQSEEMVG